MENKEIVNFSKFLGEKPPKLSDFNKENFKDFFLPEEKEEKIDYLVDNTDEFEEIEKEVEIDPSFDPPVQPEQFIIDEEEPDELEVEDSLRSYQNKNNYTKVQEVVENFYSVYKDRSETFSCDVTVEGARLNDTQARLILESDDWTLMFEGEIDRNGKCTIPLKKLNIFEEGQTGKIKLEVIAENTVFVPWEDDFKVKMSKKVTVLVPNSTKRETPQPIKESKVSVKFRK